MTAFDTDILSDLAKNVPSVVTRVQGISLANQGVPIVVAEEVLRGQLAAVRQAQAGVGRPMLEQAYAYLEETLNVLRSVRILPYTPIAHSLFQAWRAAKIRIGTQDLRIAAICVAHSAKLVSRNARDYAQVPGLNLEIWN